jgi:hypothetical protein
MVWGVEEIEMKLKPVRLVSFKSCLDVANGISNPIIVTPKVGESKSKFNKRVRDHFHRLKGIAGNHVPYLVFEIDW